MPASISCPISLKTELDRYAYSLGASDKRLNLERQMEPVYLFAQNMGRQGVRQWSEMKPAHFEAYLRSQEPITRDSDLPEVKETVANVRKVEVFVESLAEKGLLHENPLDSLTMTKAGVILKYSEVGESFAPIVNDFLSRRRYGRDPEKARAALQHHTGGLLAAGVKRFDEVNEAHLEQFARLGVDRAMAREGEPRKGLITKVRTDLSVLDDFYDFAKKKGAVERNPASGMIVTLDGRVFSQREVPARMRNQVEGYIENSRGTLSHIELGENHLREFLLHSCGENQVRALGDITREHYEDYLRTTWGRFGYEPDYVLRRHNQVSRMLGVLMAKPPSEGFSITTSGTLTSPLHREPVKLPTAEGFGNPQIARLDEVPPGFRTDAKRFMQGEVASNKASALRASGAALIRAGKCFASEGATSFRDTRQEHVEQFGKTLVAEVSATSAHIYLNHVKRLFQDIEQRGARYDDPTTGFVVQQSGPNHGNFKVSPRVAPELDVQAGKALRMLYPHNSDGRQRQVFREHLRPLFGDMTRDGITDLSDLTPEYLTKFDHRQTRNLGPKSRVLHNMRICAFQLCEQITPGKANPANVLYEAARAKDKNLGAASVNEESSLSIPQMSAPPAPTAARRMREPVAPGE